MNKQELIDEAVEQFKGKYPAQCQENIILSYRAGKEERRNRYYPFYVWHSESEYDICTKDEFEQRARELGWINGYKYGVEYETNGEKPDLPDDVLVEFFGTAEVWRERDILINWAWDLSKKFRIVDERYKSIEPTPEKSWHEKGELPPVGVECEIWELDGIWRKVEVVAHTKKGLVVEWNGEEHLIYRERKFRPIKTERERFIEAASKIMHQTEDGVINDISLGQLYDAGCRFTENKAAS